MALYEKKESGRMVIRPPYIGFIKNNWLRRGAMILATPFMFVFVESINIVRAVLWAALWIIRSMICHLISIPGSYKKLWDRPRTKDEPI